ncbi:hypothetical protein HDK64DRAFT_258976 [Phyllosticta capitalensis]
MDRRNHLDFSHPAPADMPPTNPNPYTERDTSLQPRSQRNVLARKDSKLSMGMTAFPSLEDMGTIPKEGFPMKQAADKQGSVSTVTGGFTHGYGHSVANPNGMLAVGNDEQYGREGGMSPRPPLQNSMRDDLSPKMLKRLAQGHDIQVLRDKEDAEARAKRVCQQKAIEHGLTMEILNAEYQLDYKELEAGAEAKAKRVCQQKAIEQQSFDGKKSLRKTLKHRISILFGKKPQTDATSKSTVSDSHASLSASTKSPSTGRARRNGVDLPREPVFTDEHPARRNGIDLPRETTHAAPYTFEEAFAQGNCMPPSRDTTILTQFPPFPEDTLRVGEKAKLPKHKADENSAEDVSIRDLAQRSRGKFQRKSIFGVFPEQ